MVGILQKMLSQNSEGKCKVKLPIKSCMLKQKAL